MYKFITYLLTTSLVISGAMSLLSGAPIGQSVGGGRCAVANSGLCTTVAGATTVTFDNVASGVTSYQFGIATYTWGATPRSPFVTVPDVIDQYKAPLGDATAYLSVGSGNGRPATVDIDFSQPVNYFGFYIGSPDTYNHVTFTQKGGVTTTISGANLLLPLLFRADGYQGDGLFLDFTSSDGFTRVSFVSTTAALETDNHAFSSAVPEPSTYALMGVGVVALGVVRFRRRASRCA